MFPFSWVHIWGWENLPTKCAGNFLSNIMSYTVPNLGAKLIKLMTSRHVIRKTIGPSAALLRINPTCFVGHSLLREKRSYVTRHKNCFPMCRVLQWCMWVYILYYILSGSIRPLVGMWLFAERVRILSRIHVERSTGGAEDGSDRSFVTVHTADITNDIFSSVNISILLSWLKNYFWLLIPQLLD